MPYRSDNNQQVKPPHRFPGHWLVLAVMLTTVLFAALGWHVHNSFGVLQEVIFFDAINAFGEGFQEELAARLVAERDREIGSLVVGFLIFLMSVVFWLLLLRRLRIWEQALVQEGLERRQAEIQAQASVKRTAIYSSTPVTPS